jgi:purine-cytosine permease-like protein
MKDKHRNLVVIGGWLLIKFFFLLLFGKRILGLLLRFFSEHQIQDDLTFLPFLDWFITCFLFVLVSDYLIYRIVRRLYPPGNFIMRLLAISLLDIPIIGLGVVILTQLSNYRPYQLIEASYFINHFFILLLVALKNLIAVIVLQKRL